MIFSDLVPHTFFDETSRFDPHPTTTYNPGLDCWMRDFTVYVPARLMRRRPDLLDDFIDRHNEDDWLWSGVVGEL